MSRQSPNTFWSAPSPNVKAFPHGSRSVNWRVSSILGGTGAAVRRYSKSLLTADPNLVACGEISRHLWRTKTRKTCTCGRRINNCPVWQPFRHRGKRPADWDHARLTLALLNHVSSSFSAMVDCSKTSWGSGLVPFRLQKKLSRDFLLIHLVRDPRAVCVHAPDEEPARGTWKRAWPLRSHRFRLVGCKSRLRGFPLTAPRSIPAHSLRGYRALTASDVTLDLRGGFASALAV